ncbi:ABC transporter C family member 3-like protein [Tanacetum coccineum]
MAAAMTVTMATHKVVNDARYQILIACFTCALVVLTLLSVEFAHEAKMSDTEDERPVIEVVEQSTNFAMGSDHKQLSHKSKIELMLVLRREILEKGMEGRKLNLPSFCLRLKPGERKFFKRTGQIVGNAKSKYLVKVNCERKGVKVVAVPEKIQFCKVNEKITFKVSFELDEKKNWKNIRFVEGSIVSVSAKHIVTMPFLIEVSGSVKVEGTKVYVAQSPWIQSGKIEDNILFCKEMDRERYDMVLEACSLKKDLEILSFGEQTYAAYLVRVGSFSKNELMLMLRREIPEKGIEGTELNLPSFCLRLKPDERKFYKRTGQNVGDAKSKYLVKVHCERKGVKVVVVPKKIQFCKVNEKITFKVSFELDEKKNWKNIRFVEGSIALVSAKHIVTMPFLIEVIWGRRLCKSDPRHLFHLHVFIFPHITSIRKGIVTMCLADTNAMEPSTNLVFFLFFFSSSSNDTLKVIFLFTL